MDEANSGFVLSPREGDIAELVGLGLSNKEIASHLGIRNQTVRNTLVHVFRKTSTRKRTQLAVKIILSEYDLDLPPENGSSG